MAGFAQAQLTASNLPIVRITTNTAIAGNQIDGNMYIIDNSSGVNQVTDPPTFQSIIGVKVRGSVSAAKKSYNVETWANVLGTSLNVSVLGFPAENDWVLLSSYTDRSLLRNLTGMYLYSQMGYWASRMRLCEVIINEGTGDQYQGVYLFGEKIKRDSARLDLATLQPGDNAEPEISGGYILRIDDSNEGFWASLHLPPYASGSQNIKFRYEEPADNDITPVQTAYIKGWMKKFEDSLSSGNYQDTNIGWRAYAAKTWFRDYLIFSEVMKSKDAYRKATYLYKDKSKKLRIGPPWELELSLYNTADCNASSTTGWAYQYGLTCDTSTYLPPFWWERLMTDTLFVSELKCRYTYLRENVLDTAMIFSYLDAMSDSLNVIQGGGTAQGRNFVKWPIWGVNLVNEPMGGAADYATEVARIKTFLQDRLAWLDTQWWVPGCALSVNELLGEQENNYISPNPASGNFNTHLVLNKQTKVSVSVRNLQGAVLYAKNYTLGTGEHKLNHDISEFPASIYIVTIQQGDYSRHFKLVKN